MKSNRPLFYPARERARLPRHAVFVATIADILCAMTQCLATGSADASDVGRSLVLAFMFLLFSALSLYVTERMIRERYVRRGDRIKLYVAAIFLFVPLLIRPFFFGQTIPYRLSLIVSVAAVMVGVWIFATVEGYRKDICGIRSAGRMRILSGIGHA